MVEDRERGLWQWYEFRNQAWAGIYYQIAEQIQSLGLYVRQDVADWLNSSFEISRCALGRQLNWIKGVQKI